MQFKNKTAIITAASTGIGRETAIAFAKEGAKILLVARTKDRLQETKRLIQKEGGEAEIYIVDLSDISSINKFIKEVKKNYKTVDILCNIAGIWHGKDLVYAEKDYETFDQKIIVDTHNVGIIAPSLLAHAFIPLMPQGSSIMNLSGTFQGGAKGWLPYYVSKRAIEDLTIGLSQELKEKGISVNGISPSDVATEEYKKYFSQYINDAIDPKKIAKFAVYLCSHEAKYITGKIFVLKKGKEPFESFHY